MSEDELARRHCTQLLEAAEGLIKGPRGVKIGTDFWGWPNLMFRSEAMPKIEGLIESRILYANPDDDDQNGAILRQASWDASAARKSVLKDVFLGQPPVIICPEVSINFVWVKLDWLYEALARLERLVIPLKIPKDTVLLRQIHHLRIERSDRTVIEVSWDKGTSGSFKFLNEAWVSLWQQMGAFLRNGERIEPGENW